MKILITGHTGFKGSWLALMLYHLNHQVSGISLNSEPSSHFNLSGIDRVIRNDLRFDIRDKIALNDSLRKVNPEFIFHLAAQPLVKWGYRDPEYTYEVNVNGTLNILEASRGLPDLKGLLIITTDKVYANSINNSRPFVESDSLGFSDPYSTSKAMADLLTQSWTENSKDLPVGIARAGNVIGGGDFGLDRLIPDLVRDASSGRQTLIRYPKAVRPWQYVLDCLNGYLLQMDHIIKGNREAFNFGPDFGEYYPVEKVADRFLYYLSKGGWILDKESHPHEANFLTLDSRKAGKTLNWKNKYQFEESLQVTANWYRAYLDGEDLVKSSQLQIEEFLAH